MSNISHEIGLDNNRCGGRGDNMGEELSWLTSPQSTSCSPCRSAASTASSNSTNAFFPASEEAFYGQLDIPIINADSREGDLMNTGIQAPQRECQRAGNWVCKHFPKINMSYQEEQPLNNLGGQS